MSGRNQNYLIPILVLIALAIWVNLPNSGIHLGSFQRDGNFKLGLDLVGGVQALLEADLPPDATVEADALKTASKIIENRVNGLGVSEAVVQVVGNTRIILEVPDISDPDQALGVVKETGLLEFANMGSTPLPAGTILQTDFGMTDVPADALNATDPQNKIWHTVMTGSALKTVAVTTDQSGRIAVSFTLTDAGKQIFAEYTSSHVGQYLAIVLDKKIISAPQVQSAITGGSGVITGNFTTEEANNLAVQLRYGSLPIPLKVIESKTVGPTLGQDSLRKSLMAGLIGSLIVMLFMALYYRLPGIVADLALIVYALLSLALFKLIPVTLTLPGIAGFVLSMGVAVDANVLIFERLKEELRAGRTLVQAIDLGWKRAWPSIRDSNLSTLITCTILFWFGSAFGASIVKGFALTLALGVLVSLFTAITVTRTFLHLILDNVKSTEHPKWFGV